MVKPSTEPPSCKVTTERRLAEEALRQQREQFEVLLERVNGISWALNLADSRFTYISPNAERILGYPLEDWVDMDSWFAMVEPEDREYARNFCEMETAAGRDHVFECRMRKPDDQMLWMLEIVTIIKDQTGKPVGLTGFMLDNTARHALLADLKSKESYQRALFDNFPFLVWLKDTRSRFLAVNRPFAIAAGFDDPNRLYGKTDLDIWPCDLAEAYRADDREVMSRREKKDVEEQVVFAGEQRWVETYKAPVENADGELLGTVGFARDISARKGAEAELKESEARLKNILEGTNVGTWDWNIQTGELVINERWANIMGYELDELAPVAIHTWRDHVHPDDLPGAEAALKRHFAYEDDYYDVEFRQPHKDGGWVWVNARGKVIEWAADDVPVRMAGTHLDITERKRAEDRRREADALFAKAFQAAGTLMVLSTLEDGVIEDVNDAFVEVTGYSRQEAIGARSVDLGIISADDRTYYKRLLSLKGSLRNLEVTLMTKSREMRYGLYNCSIIETGGTRKILSIVQNITPLKQSQLALKASEERFALAMRGSNDGLFDWDLLTNQVYYSPRWKSMLGYDDYELENHFNTWERLVSDADSKRSWSMLRDYMAGKRDDFAMEFRMRHKDGHWVDILSRAFLVRDYEGNPARIVGTHADISERRHAEQALATERAFLQNVIDGIDDPIVVVAPNYRVMRMNRVAKVMADRLGLDKDCVTCHQLSHESIHPCASDDHPCPLSKVLETRSPLKVVHRHFSPKGERRTYEIAASPLFDDNGEVIGIIEASRDITEHLAVLDELKERELSYAHLAQHDPLTGLPNRLLFADRLGQAIHSAHRNGTEVAVLFVDLDHFKHVNDSFDHSYGDEVLKIVTERLRGLFREDDTLARMGGDEFTVILGQIERDEEAALVARKILECFKEPFENRGHSVFLGASIGISLYPHHGTTVDDLVRNADTAMYRAKDEGRNTFHYYSEELTTKAFERILLEAHLHKALDNDDLVLHYQPQIDLGTGKLCGLEALVRWRHPEMGLISPLKFIPLAEESGLIVPMGEWILREACRQVKSWQDAGIVPVEASIGVNLSAKQFDQSGLIEMVDGVLKSTGLAATNLELEITEFTMMRSSELSRHILQHLRALGVKLAIDDFGTGYSSLSHLKLLPLTKLKIDRSFVSDIPRDANDVAIAKAIIALGHSLSFEVLAEGIETPEQQAFLTRQGCHMGQGYLFARPLNSVDFEVFMCREASLPDLHGGT